MLELRVHRADVIQILEVVSLPKLMGGVKEVVSKYRTVLVCFLDLIRMNARFDVGGYLLIIFFADNV